MPSTRTAESRAKLLPSQISLRSLLLIFIPFALALAFPAFGIFAPIAIFFFAMIASIVVVVSAIHLIFADDRRAVLSLAMESMRGLLMLTIFAVAYFTYALLMCHVGFED